MATPAYSGGPWGIKDGEDQSILNLAAHNLTPEQLATLNSTGQLDVAGANGQTIRYYKNPDQYDNPGADSGLARTLVSSDNGYKAVVNPFGSDAHLGNVFLNYDGQGNYTNPTTYAPSTSMFKDVITNPGVLMMLTAGLGSALGAGAGMASAGTGEAIGAGSAAGYAGLDAASAATLGGGYGVAGGTALGAGELGAGLGAAGAGGLLGDATAAGYGGLDAASASTLGGGFSVDGGTALGAGAGAGAGGYGSASDLFSQGFTDGGTAGGALDTGYASGGATSGLMSSAGTIVKSAAEKAADLAKGANSSGLLGAAATGLGALAGSQGQQANQSSVRDIPEWLKPYANQSLNAAQGLLQQQTAPGAMQGYQSMRDVGRGLLATPQMGNGFNRFFPGR